MILLFKEGYIYAFNDFIYNFKYFMKTWKIVQLHGSHFSVLNFLKRYKHLINMSRNVRETFHVFKLYIFNSIGREWYHKIEMKVAN